MFERVKACAKCNKFFQAKKETQRFCSKICLDAGRLLEAAERVPHNCTECGTEYLITRGAKKQKKNKAFCPPCLKVHRSKLAKANQAMVENQGRHNGVYFRNKPPKVKINAPCATCIHGVVNQASDIGWMCRANAMVCRPLAGKHLYTARLA